MVNQHRNVESLISIAASDRIDISSFPEPPDWYGDALCTSTDPESFFPPKGGSTSPAKATCLRCDVRPTCLEYALDNQERFGIWGGKSERERRKILRLRKEPA